MFSAQEESYIKSLIGSYYTKGYKNYLVHTVTETDNNYDMYIYFSENDITAFTPTTFDLTESIFIKIDSSSRNDNSYNTSVHSRSIVENSSYTGILEVNQAEFIYTNALCDYSTSTSVVHPDVLMGDYSVTSGITNELILVVLLITFLYTFVCNILRMRK